MYICICVMYIVHKHRDEPQQEFCIHIHRINCKIQFTFSSFIFFHTSFHFLFFFTAHTVDEAGIAPAYAMYLGRI